MILENPELICFLAILMILLTIGTSGTLAMLWGSCAIGFVGLIWFKIITDDLDDDEW